MSNIEHGEFSQTATQSRVAEEYVPNEPQNNAEAPESKVTDWIKERQEAGQERLDAVVAGFGSVATRMMVTLNDPEKSAADKVGGGLSGVVGFAGEAMKFAGRTTAFGMITDAMPKEFRSTYTAGVEGAVNSLTSKVAKEKEDGSYSFDAAGIAAFAGPKALIATGIEAGIAGVDSGASKHNEFNEAALEADPTSKSAQVMKTAYELYDSKVGDMAKNAASKALMKKFTKQV